MKTHVDPKAKPLTRQGGHAVDKQQHAQLPSKELPWTAGVALWVGGWCLKPIPQGSFFDISALILCI